MKIQKSPLERLKAILITGLFCTSNSIAIAQQSSRAAELAPVEIESTRTVVPSAIQVRIDRLKDEVAAVVTKAAGTEVDLEIVKAEEVSDKEFKRALFHTKTLITQLPNLAGQSIKKIEYVKDGAATINLNRKENTVTWHVNAKEMAENGKRLNDEALMKILSFMGLDKLLNGKTPSEAFEALTKKADLQAAKEEYLEQGQPLPSGTESVAKAGSNKKTRRGGVITSSGKTIRQQATDLGYHPHRIIVKLDEDKGQTEATVRNQHPAVSSVRKLRSQLTLPNDTVDKQKSFNRYKQRVQAQGKTTNAKSADDFMNKNHHGKSRITRLRDTVTGPQAAQMNPRRKARIEAKIAQFDQTQQQRERMKRSYRILTLKPGTDPQMVVQHLKEAGYQAAVDKVVYKNAVRNKDALKWKKRSTKTAYGNPEMRPSRSAVKQTAQVQANGQMQILDTNRIKDPQAQDRHSGNNGNPVYFLGSGYQPTDELLFLQWYMAGPPVNAGISALDSFNVYPTLYGDPGITVGVVDSGIEFDNPDFYTDYYDVVPFPFGDGNTGSYIVPGADFVDGDNYPLDWDGHGTLVSGLVGAVSDNEYLPYCIPFANYEGCGIAGVSSNMNVWIMPIRNLDEDGAGFVSDSADAIIYGVDNGVDVLNLSFSSGGFSFILEDAVDYAEDYGVILVSSAGNDGIDTDALNNLHYPSGYNNGNILSVGSTDVNGDETYFTNYGECTVDFFSPGEDIISTSFYDDEYVDYEDQLFFYVFPWHDYQNGTSFSAPITTAVLAQVMGQYPDMTVEELMFVMRMGTIPEINYTGRNLTGGRLDMLEALYWAGEVWSFNQIPFDIGPSYCLNGDYTEYYNPPSGSSGGGGCFIATAAYGTPMSEDINWLRTFRDKFMQTNTVGRMLVNLYYTYGPKYADKLSQSEFAKKVVRTILIPFVSWSKLTVKNPLIGFLMAFVLMGLFFASCLALFRRIRIRVA